MIPLATAQSWAFTFGVIAAIAYSALFMMAVWFVLTMRAISEIHSALAGQNTNANGGAPSGRCSSP